MKTLEQINKELKLIGLSASFEPGWYRPYRLQYPYNSYRSFRWLFELIEYAESELINAEAGQYEECFE